MRAKQAAAAAVAPLPTKEHPGFRLLSIVSAGSLIAAATAAAASCGGNTVASTTGGVAAPPHTFAPQGCAFSIATRPEYIDFALSTPVVGASPNIRRVRLGLGGNVTPGVAGHADPATSIGVAWQTDDGTLVSEMAWGNDPDPAKWPEKNRTSGVTWLTPAAALNSSGDQRMHEAYVCGLTPATTYYYRVGGGPKGSEVWSDVVSFRTTPSDPTAAVSIGISGDSRGDLGNAFRLVQRQMKLASVDIQIFSGDMVNFATDQGAWEYWLDTAWKDSDNSYLTLSQILTLSTHGNHENHTTLFFANLVLPQEIPAHEKYAELFYSVDVGPVHIIVVDDGWVASPTDDPDYAAALAAWLNADLEAATKNRAKVPWIITDHHHSAFSSSNHGGDPDVLRVRDFFVPIWDKYHVDMAIAGHDHNYERSKPLTGPSTTPTLHASHKDGTIYVGCAGAGAPAYSPGISDFTEMSHGYKDGAALGLYGIITADAKTLKLEAHDLLADASDPVFDTVTLTH